jgi:hypothetical protein
VKVAANEEELAILLAQTEVEQGEATSLDALIVAFKRAAKLRDTLLHTAVVIGTNDRVRRTVKVTTEEKVEGRATYHRCLMPYTEHEVDNRRRTRPEYKQRREGLQTYLPAYYHELWIRRDRLEFV